MRDESLPTIMHIGPTHEDKTFMESTKSRLDAVLDLYKKGLAKPIIFTVALKMHYVGITREDGWEEMKIYDKEHDYASDLVQYFVKKGVKPEDILYQRQGIDTFGEVFFLAKTLKEHKFKRIRVITNDFHMPRCLAIYRLMLGNEIEIIPFRVYSRMDTDPKLRALVDKREAYSLGLFNTQFSDVKPGDMKRIEEIMYSQHLLYKELPKEEKVRIYS